MVALFRRHPDAIAPAFVLALGLAAILGAWGFQIIGGYVPCPLCLQQRIPYYVGLPIVLAALAAAAAGLPTRVVGALMAIATVTFAVGVYLAIYHAGVEWRWWAGPPDCSGSSTEVHSTEDLLNQLKGIHVVSCTDAAFRFLGLSFAGWNAVVSAVLTVASAYAALGVLRPARTAPAE